MQTLESLVGVSPSSPYAVTQMPEGQPSVAGWNQAYVQSSMEQASTNSSPYLMNVLKPDQTRVRMEQPQTTQLQSQSGGGMLPPTNPASVITATYNPTYNRCLPKILSDLDCEMKIKQVLKCIENILLDGSDMDTQPSYKLPDRSSSPQLAPKKKIKVKEDEDMGVSPASNSGVGTPVGAAKAPTNKSPVRINVKVEPFETEKAQRGSAINNGYPDQGTHQVPSASPRSHSYDFSVAGRMQPNNFPKQQTPPQRAFSFEPYTYSANPQNNAAQQFVHQSFLQHPQVVQHSNLLVQQQQHLQAVHQHLQAQHQHILNGVTQVGTMQVIPMLQQNGTQHHMQYPMQQVVAHQNSQQVNEGQQPASSQQSQVSENPSYASVQMDEFPFPVFSSTILEEVNHFKSTPGREDKKQNEGEEQVFFFGGPGNPNLLYATSAQNDLASHGQSTDNSHQQEPTRYTSGLGSSSLLSHASLPLLFQMPQLSGLEEDDKWILSLLNIDGHENAPAPAPGF